MAGKIDVYENVTNRVLELLEQGVVPWRKPWNSGNAPRNLEGHVYRGINVFLLHASGYASPFWLTYKQAKERGGTVKKGEHGTLIVFWKRLRITEKNEAGKPETKVIPLLRYYYVFNLEQTEGVKVPKKVADWQTSRPEHTPLASAEEIIAGYQNGPEITFDDEAYYIPARDVITVPPREAYAIGEEYYSTLFHEIGHSTGHPSRLNRKIANTFGSHEYGREELVAEMASTFLCAEAGIESTFENSAAYLRSWISTIKEDPKAVVIAAGQAQRAVDHVLGRTFEEKASEETSGAETLARAS